MSLRRPHASHMIRVFQSEDEKKLVIVELEKEDEGTFATGSWESGRMCSNGASRASPSRVLRRTPR